MAGSRSERSAWRRLRHRLRPVVSRPFAKLFAWVLPPLYVAYMRFVWATSRIEIGNFGELNPLLHQHNGTVAILWHEEVFTVAWAYPWAGIEGHTLASVGDAGEVIARMLKRCGFVVFRGGSTSHRSRRREGVVEDMIDHMKTTPNVIYGLTVDGSKGPAYRLKRGCIVIAQECGVPIAMVRTWYQRSLRLRTWDRTAVPLPFNTIRYYYRGPFFVPEDADTEAGFERFRRELEDGLIDLAAESYADAGQVRPGNLVKSSS